MTKIIDLLNCEEKSRYYQLRYEMLYHSFETKGNTTKIYDKMEKECSEILLAAIGRELERRELKNKPKEMSLEQTINLYSDVQTSRTVIDFLNDEEKERFQEANTLMRVSKDSKTFNKYKKEVIELLETAGERAVVHYKR